MHVTLGSLISELEKAPPAIPVKFAGCFLDGVSPGMIHSYQGGLAFEPRIRTTTAADLLATAKVAADGYGVPLWAAAFQNCGVAIVDLSIEDDRVVLFTKRVD